MLKLTQCAPFHIETATLIVIVKIVRLLCLLRIISVHYASNCFCGRESFID